MKSKISAVLLGFMISFVISLTLTCFIDAVGLVGQVIYQCLPPLIGGVVTGYLVRRRGWVFGLLVAILHEGLIVIIAIWAFSWASTVDAIFRTWASNWCFLLGVLFVGTGGGFLGELLAKARRQQFKNPSFKSIGIVFAIIIGLFIANVLTDRVIQYRFWKKVQRESFSFVENTLSDLASKDSSELQRQLLTLESFFNYSNTVKFDRGNIRKLAKKYILHDILYHKGRIDESPDIYDYKKRYLRGHGLAQSCYFEFLVILYKKKSGFYTDVSKPAPYKSFCHGWNELDREFGFWDCPDGRRELRK
ncbi:MAG: TIGR04086 family membrane protein [bacterium]